MPITLKFKLKNNDETCDSEKQDVLVETVLNMPCIVHRGGLVKEYQSDNKITITEIQINGLSIIDDESLYMLIALVIEQLELTGSPFCIYSIVTLEECPPGDALFLHQRFKPSFSKNAALISQIKDIKIPDEYLCPLSGQLIDEPVFDVRTPTIIYDNKFLMYWLNKSSSREMPHSRLPANNCFLKTHYELLGKINSFIEKSLNDFDIKNLENVLTRCYLDKNSRDITVYNQALRRSTAYGTMDDCRLLLKFGANINAQDNIPEKRLTALHIALSRNNVDFARQLIFSGAKIDIKNGKGVTAHDLILKLSDEDDRQSLLSACKTVKLLPSDTIPSSTVHHGIFRQNAQSTTLPDPTRSQFSLPHL